MVTTINPTTGHGMNHRWIFGVRVSPEAYVANPETVDDPSRLTVAIDPGAPDGKIVVVLQDHGWEGRGVILGLKAGYRFNGASIPRLARPLMDRLDLGVAAAAYHDALYEGTGMIKPEHGVQFGSRLRRVPEVEDIFHTMMLQDGVSPKNALWAYRATRLFGGPTWERYERAGT
jgi:hypothetical protein